MLAAPKDFVGTILALVIARAMERPSRSLSVKKWKMSIAIVTDYYPLTLTFDKGLRVVMGTASLPTLIVTMSLEDIVKIARGNTTMIRAFLKRRIRVKGLLRHPLAMLRFYRLMSAALGGR